MASASVQIREVWRCPGAWIDETHPDSVVLSRVDMIVGAESTEDDMRAARAVWQDLRVRIRARVPPGFVLCRPTVSDVPPRRGASEQERRASVFPSLSLLSVAVLGRLPQISLPGTALAGLPVGLSLIGAAGADEQLLALARAFGGPEDGG